MCTSCRFYKVLQNEYLLAKIGVKTADNELSEVGGLPIRVGGYITSEAISEFARRPARFEKHERRATGGTEGRRRTGRGTPCPACSSGTGGS